MDLKEYFESKKGVGVLATADESGKVNTAVYSRPHVMSDTEIAFIMADRKSHDNVTKNPYAAFLFKEDGPGYSGKRLSLSMTREEDDPELISSLRRKEYADVYSTDRKRYLVYFSVDEVLPLVGSAE